jgi:hypothetical protein
MTRFRVIAIVLLLWNLMGVAAFAMQWSAAPEDIGDPVTARAFATMPGWAWLAYAAAVGLGTAGAVALLMRRKLAWMLFVLSLICVVAQFGWTVFGFGIIAAKGWSSMAFPAVIALITLFAAIYARARASDRTLR